VIGQWNQYLLPLVLMANEPKHWVITQGIANISVNAGYDADWPGLFAALTMAMPPRDHHLHHLPASDPVGPDRRSRQVAAPKSGSPHRPGGGTVRGFTVSLLGQAPQTPSRGLRPEPAEARGQSPLGDPEHGLDDDGLAHLAFAVHPFDEGDGDLSDPQAGLVRPQGHVDLEAVAPGLDGVEADLLQVARRNARVAAGGVMQGMPIISRA